jgi:hypothetical protein
LSPAKPKKTEGIPSNTTEAELKAKFENLIVNLQSEFNSMLEARKIIKEQNERMRRE